MKRGCGRRPIAIFTPLAFRYANELIHSGSAAAEFSTAPNILVSSSHCWLSTISSPETFKDSSVWLSLLKLPALPADQLQGCQFPQWKTVVGLPQLLRPQPQDGATTKFQVSYFPNPFGLLVMVQKLRGNPELMGLSDKGLEA